MKRVRTQRKEYDQLVEKIEKFFEDRCHVREALFNELEEVVRKFGLKKLQIPKLLELFRYEIGSWKIFFKRIDVPEKEIADILLKAAGNSGNNQGKTIEEEGNG